ncbi:ORF071 [Staphylococcus phage 47]|uniref:ORF071 n=2 Tax=root TaxID=1 RepID=Q4ZCJ7_9CAUD|nr:ORF071 [Staphylococcus phage 47]AAX91246.1 ORF071 [Staphylococcus phage 47]
MFFFRGEKRANYLNKGKHAWKTQRFKNAKTVDMTRFLYVCIQRRIIYSPSHYDDMFNSRKALTPVFSSVL